MCVCDMKSKARSGRKERLEGGGRGKLVLSEYRIYLSRNGFLKLITMCNRYIH